jgi:Carboxypeptidase regulatory-like domain
MNIAHQIGFLGFGRNREAIRADLHDEFEFHIQSLASELVEQGWTAEDARQEAERKFGCRARIERECQSIQRGAWGWVSRFLMVGVVVSIVCIGSLTYSLIALKTQNELLRSKLRLVDAVANSNPNTTAEPIRPPIASLQEKLSLTGKVVDEKGNPIPNAKIILIHKSWPNQTYRQEGDDSETDENGGFEFPDLYATSSQNAFLVSVFADGFEMKSEYVTVKAKKKVSLFEFKLKAAKPITFTFLNEEGAPLAETDVALLGRKAGTKEFMIYEQSAEAAKMTTDANGKLKVNYLRTGDIASFGVLIFGEVHTQEKEIDESDEQEIRLQKKR